MKKLLAALLVLSSATVLTACSASEIEIVVPDELTSKKITIDFAHVSGDDSALGAVYEEIKEDFETEYPNITVNLNYVEGSYNGLIDYIEGALIKKKQPNVTVGYPGNFIEYAAAYKGTAVANLDQFIDHETWGFSAADIKDFQDAGFWSEGQSYDEDGTTYSLPLAKSTEAFYVNRNVAVKGIASLKNVSAEDITDADIKTQVATWDGVFELAEELEKINSNEPTDAKVTPYQIHHDTNANFAITIFQQFKGAYLSQENKFDFTMDTLNANSKEAVQYLLDNNDYIKLRDGSNYGSGLISDKKWDSATSSVVDTNPLAWANVGSSSCGTYYKNVSDLLILPVPQMTTSATDTEYNQYAYLQGPSICMLANTNQDENLAAWLFMQYLTTTTNSVKIAKATGYMPVRDTCYDDAAGFVKWLEDAETTTDAKQACLVAISQKSWYSADPVFVGSDTGRDEAGYIIENVLAKDYTIAAAFATAKENLELI